MTRDSPLRAVTDAGAEHIGVTETLPETYKLKVLYHEFRVMTGGNC